jgi:TRAP transporter TAXI family solute receptor
MNKKPFVSGILLLVVTLFLFSGASNAGANPDWKPDFKYMKIMGTSAGSSWYTWAINMGLELEKKFPGLKCSAIEGNTSKNTAGTNNDYTTFGLTFMISLADAWFGEGTTFKGKEHRNLRYVGTFVNEWFTVVVRKGANIEDGHFTRDIVKLRFSPGAKIWSSQFITTDGLKALGINEETVRKAGGAIQYVGYKDMTTMLQDRNLDAALVWQTMPTLIFQSVVNTPPGVYMPRFTKRELEIFVSGQPERIREVFFFGEIPDNYLSGGRKGGPTIGFTAPIIVHKDLPEEMVYQITKIAYESKKVKECCGPVKDCLTLQDPLLGKPKYFPIHPGALKYWKERGLIK